MDTNQIIGSRFFTDRDTRPVDCDPAIIRYGLGAAVLCTLVALAFSFWVHWPWLYAEHCRLEPAHAILIWLGDALTLLWFVWFGIRYCLAGWPLPDAPAKDTERRYLLLSLTGAFVIDLIATGIIVHNEAVARQNAIQVQGEITAGRPTVNEKKAYIRCRFQDRNGVGYESHHQVGLADQPLLVKDAVRLGKFPVPVVIAYDPQWPPRCWLVGFDNQEDNRIQWLSLSFFVFQVGGIGLALSCKPLRTEVGIIPLYKIIPFWAELTPLFVAAVGKCLEGEW